MKEPKKSRTSKRTVLQPAHAVPQEQLPPITISLKELYNERERYTVYPRFQRKEVWNLKQRQQLIDTILLGDPIPPFEGYEEFDANGGKVWKIIDGHQRITAIIDFMNGGFKTWTDAQKRVTEPNSTVGAIQAGRGFEEMDVIARSYFIDYRIRIDKVRNTSESELITRFMRIQNHVPLSAAEKLNAYASKAKSAAQTIEQHSLWDLYEGKTLRNRLQLFQSSLYLLALEMTPGGMLDLNSGGGIHGLAIGRHDDEVTDDLLESVMMRLDIVCHLFHGFHFTIRAASIAMYQAVMFLEEDGYIIRGTDKGVLTPWLTSIISESLHASGVPSYNQPIQRLTSGKRQKEFWNLNRKRVFALLHHKDAA